MQEERLIIIQYANHNKYPKSSTCGLAHNCELQRSRRASHLTFQLSEGSSRVFVSQMHTCRGLIEPSMWQSTDSEKDLQGSGFNLGQGLSEREIFNKISIKKKKKHTQSAPKAKIIYKTKFELSIFSGIN